MGLFFDVLGAINDPNQQASVGQLGSLLSSVQQISQQTGLDAGTTQNVISALGGALRPVLQQQNSEMGGQQLAGMLSQLAGGGSNSLGGMLGQVAGGNPLGGMLGQAATAAVGGNALQSLIPAQMQQQIAQAVAQKTGLDATMVQSLLPMLIPVVLGFLNLGANKPGAPGGASNPLLSAFLDSDRDGDTDLGDVMKFATRFLSPA
ncbi:MAG: DUF937 domain-containing protein [Oscillatoriophycideae cyanobacterium NC_groundwater_1537_Pr4_S-0.65um_50_18]|nr:DUF937 domain-containing protein [Oscillatoriophycideae cyanobacterium NC_groundwater_1537_Pr4_S-0.65um_50_18]